jgi:Protein of unknown function (DUF732)
MIRTLLVVAALGGAALNVAAPAGADNADFIQFLGSNGENVSTQEIQNLYIDLGQAICQHLDASQNPNATVDYLVSLGHTNRNANMWLSGSVLYLCPQLNYLTRYAPNR